MQRILNIIILIAAITIPGKSRAVISISPEQASAALRALDDSIAQSDRYISARHAYISVLADRIRTFGPP